MSQPTPSTMKPFTRIDLSVHKHSGYVLFVLSLVSFFNYADRAIISMLLQPIKEDLLLSDTQLGFLTGFAFAIIYAICGIPLARLADKKSRVAMLSVIMVFWTAMTALCGAAQNFVHLFLARVGVGVGEAGCFPASTSLLCDYFPQERRAFALGMFQSAGALGVMVAMMLSGYIADTFGWRWAFFVISAPGLLVAALVWFTVQDGRRANLNREVIQEKSISPSWLEAVSILLRRPTYRKILMAYSLGYFALYGITQWIPTYIVRYHGISLTDIGLYYGFTVGLGGFIGSVVGSVFSVKLIARNRRWELYIPCLAFSVSAPLFALVFFLPTFHSILICIFFAGLISSIGLGPGYASVQSVAEPHLRATAVAIVLFFIALIGQGAGPFMVGFFSDYLAQYYGEDSLQVSLIGSTVIIFIAAFYYYLASKTLEQDRVS